MRLSLPSGAPIVPEEFLESMISSSDMCTENTLVLTCVLVAPQPFGAKHDARRSRSFGTKGAIMVEMQIQNAERKGKPIVSCWRTPIPELREEVLELIASSFSSGVSKLIESAIESAHKKVPSARGVDGTSHQTKFLFE